MLACNTVYTRSFQIEFFSNSELINKLTFPLHSTGSTVKIVQVVTD